LQDLPLYPLSGGHNEFIKGIPSPLDHENACTAAEAAQHCPLLARA